MVESEKELQRLAEEYITDKAQLDKLKKKVDSTNLAIKQLMDLLDIDSVNVGDKSICYTVQKRESLDEDKLLAQLKHFAPSTECIKTKEYIDMDILEQEIYHGRLSQDALVAMDSCREVKEIQKLDIRKAKKG